jgi:hypothetical protein
MSLAQLALPKWPALVIGVSGEHGCVGAAPANGALCRVSAREQLNLAATANLSALFFLEAEVIGGDAGRLIEE